MHFDREGPLASESDDITIQLRNTKTEECIGILTGQRYDFYSVSFDRVGRLANGSWDRPIKLWNRH